MAGFKGDVLAVLNGKEAVNTVSESSAEEFHQAATLKLKPIVAAKKSQDEPVAAGRGQSFKEAQNTAAMLTTYNEADMSAVISMRNEFKEAFRGKT